MARGGRLTGEYRLIFVDVDGTLLTAERRVDERTVAAIAAARRRGIRISLATGRTYLSARPYAEAVGADAPLVTCNGARIQAAGSGEVHKEWRLDPGLARRVLESLDGFDVHVSLFHDEAIYIAAWSERARDSAEKDGVEFVPVGDLRGRLDRAPLKLMIIGDEPTIERLEPHLKGAFARAGEAPPSIVRSEPTYLEVWHAEASKAAAAAYVAARLGVPMSQVIAFGDSLNDLALLRAVGLGVAMGNAHPDVKRAARMVAESNQDGGVGRALERILHLSPRPRDT